MVNTNKIIFLQVPPWDGLWTRQNHFSLLFSEKQFEILYVEANYSFIRSLNKNFFSFLNPLPKFTKPDKNITVLKNVFFIPGAKYSDFIAKINSLIIATYIKFWLSKNNWDSYFCWCRVPLSVFTLNKLNPKKTFYDVTDDYKSYEKTSRTKSKLIIREKKLSKIADKIFITNKLLEDSITLEKTKITYLPNGYKKSFFEKSHIDKIDKRGLIKSNNEIVIGYIGLITYWMDFKLLKRLNDHFDNKIVMIGPVHDSVKNQISNLDKINFIGKVNQSDLVYFLKEIDILIIPQILSEVRKKSNPLKLWEYLATGKPIVTVPFPIIDSNLKGLINVVDDHDSFIHSIENIIKNGDKESLSNMRVEYSSNFTWEKIFNQVLLTNM